MTTGPSISSRRGTVFHENFVVKNFQNDENLLHKNFLLVILYCMYIQ